MEDLIELLYDIETYLKYDEGEGGSILDRIEQELNILERELDTKHMDNLIDNINSIL